MVSVIPLHQHQLHQAAAVVAAEVEVLPEAEVVEAEAEAGNLMLFFHVLRMKSLIPFLLRKCSVD